MDIGAAIRKHRGKTCSQSELARRVGVTQTTISDWELGVAQPSLDQIRTIEDALALPLGALLFAGGYVEAAGIEAAILADAAADIPELDEEGRDTVLRVYLLVRAGRQDRRNRRR